MKRIPVAGPWITQREIDYVKDTVKTAWYEDHNKYHTLFERQFAAYVARKFAITLPSCTSALHLCLASLDLNPDDEVIVPDITWIATAAPISYVGARPVFADIDPKTWCLSATSFEENLSSRTKAVILVDLYGNMPDMDIILDIAKSRDILVIEDAAQAIGVEYRQKRAGSFGDASVFSFHGTKTLTTGEGGILVTDNADMYQRCRFLADHGRGSGTKIFWNTEVAYKYKMSSMQAALGLAQLERVDDLIAKKRQIFSWYYDELKSVDGLTLNYQGPDVRNTYWMVTVVLDPAYGLLKDNVIHALFKRGVESRPFFYPLSSLPAYATLPQAEVARERNENAYRISPYALNLPSALNLTYEQVKYVCDVLKEILRRASSKKRFDVSL